MKTTIFAMTLATLTATSALASDPLLPKYLQGKTCNENSRWGVHTFVHVVPGSGKAISLYSSVTLTNRAQCQAMRDAVTAQKGYGVYQGQAMSHPDLAVLRVDTTCLPCAQPDGYAGLKLQGTNKAAYWWLNTYSIAAKKYAVNWKARLK